MGRQVVLSSKDGTGGDPRLHSQFHPLDVTTTTTAASYCRKGISVRDEAHGIFTIQSPTCVYTKHRISRTDTPFALPTKWGGRKSGPFSHRGGLTDGTGTHGPNQTEEVPTIHVDGFGLGSLGNVGQEPRKTRSHPALTSLGLSTPKKKTDPHPVPEFREETEDVFLSGKKVVK